MAYFLQFLTLIGLLLSSIIYAYKISMRKTQEKGNKLVAPEPSGALPFIGHLHQLRVQVPIPRILGNMADDYGPAYSLRLGSHQALVISSQQMVKDCFTINERNFATRPNLSAGRYLNYDNAGFGMSPYGPYWREMRKMAVSELFTSQRVEMFKHIRTSQVKNSIMELYALCQRNGGRASAINISKWFECIPLNIIVRILVGKAFSNGNNEQDSHVKEAIKKLLYLSGFFVVSDFFPNLEWMDIGGHLKSMKQVAKELDGVIEKWLNEHIEKRQERGSNKEGDFMDLMLSSLPQDTEMFGYGRETIIKATTLVLMWTGSESTAVTMTWTLSLLLNHPHILKGAQEELDIHVGREKWAEESDIKNLVYLQAIVKETLRLYPPGPLAGPHEAIEDCKIGGYHVTKGTRLIMNVWKLHHDPQVWSDPHEFRPERFLKEHSEINYSGQNFEYIPFSTGRRMCPATMFASNVLHLTFARLLQGFDLSTPMGKPVDMSEGLGLTLPKAEPLEVTITPRLSPELY
ncbi:putative cytochrome P450 [Helianthus annuus]|nr:putative cytochrome P450 [Helianthus annuus]KAJ0554315.1 putative cytochrome P450 [Helianthus annuus]KAJ0898830.1 putative cytochrome P450 [Helianthus annuus]KAJ0902450.1 putative cytochrome P450 [Helianthus annuus]